MTNTNIYNINNEIVGSIALNENIFCVDVSPDVLHSVVQMQRTLKRQGTSSSKTRAETRGGGKKPWKQKGTGRARAGSKRSPIWRGGGIVFGPKPKSYIYRISKRVRRQALCMALSTRNYEKRILVLDSLNFDEIKTKNFINIMGNFGLKNCLIISSCNDNNLYLSLRNVTGFKLLTVQGMNVYDILKHHNLIITKESIELVQERLVQ